MSYTAYGAVFIAILATLCRAVWLAVPLLFQDPDARIAAFYIGCCAAAAMTLMIQLDLVDFIDYTWPAWRARIRERAASRKRSPT